MKNLTDNLSTGPLELFVILLLTLIVTAGANTTIKPTHPSTNATLATASFTITTNSSESYNDTADNITTTSLPTSTVTVEISSTLDDMTSTESATTTTTTITTTAAAAPTKTLIADSSTAKALNKGSASPINTESSTKPLPKSTHATHTSKQTISSVPKVPQTTKTLTIEPDISTTEVYNDNNTDITNSSESNTTDSKSTHLMTTSSLESYLAVNGTCRLGFVIQDDMCVYLCKDKVCQNDGECAIVTDATGNSPEAICRCKQDDDVEYSGDNCEVTKTSRLKERKITLGVLIPLTCILFLALTCTCIKLKRIGKADRDLKNNYELNSGTL